MATSILAAALKCRVRDRWIGWDFRSHYGRLNLIANNARFLILPDWHLTNVGSRVLSLTEWRIVADWQARFGHPLLLLETFVDPRRAQGCCHRFPVVLSIAAGAVLCGMQWQRAASLVGWLQERNDQLLVFHTPDPQHRKSCRTRPPIRTT